MHQGKAQCSALFAVCKVNFTKQNFRSRIRRKSYRKIPKISPEAYIFGGAYLRREICISKSIGLALQIKVNLPVFFCFTLYLRVIFQVQAPGGLYLEGRFNGGFFALPVWGAYIWRGLYMGRLIFGILRYIPIRNFQSCN